jgi:hypothetical protein
MAILRPLPIRLLRAAARGTVAFVQRGDMGCGLRHDLGGEVMVMGDRIDQPDVCEVFHQERIFSSVISIAARR